MMERKESQSKSRRIEDAFYSGQATECIGKKCVCWWYCSYHGATKVQTCTSDLSTGFYRSNVVLTCEGAEYRDPERAGKSGVFKKKRKRNNTL